MNNKAIYILITLLIISNIFLYSLAKKATYVSQLSSALQKTQMHSYSFINKKIDFDTIEAF